MRALVVSQSPLATDPRVRRQITWLTADGWQVDSVGIGEAPPEAERHFRMTAETPVARPKLGKGLIHLLLPYRARFRLLTQSRIPAAAGKAIAAGTYDLIVFNDYQLLPWILDRRAFPEGLRSRMHLDMHEYRPDRLDAGSPFAPLVGGYYSWIRGLIGSPRWDTRSVVASGIGDLYVEEFGFGKMAVVRNAPPFERLEPSPVGDTIDLIHHGAADPRRGLHELIAAMHELPTEFTLTLMLVGRPDAVAALREEAAPLGDRVRFVPPAPMADLSRTISRYDLEVMFYPPVTENLQFALPNKLFEAVQGRLGLVIGPSPMMAEVVREYRNGVIAGGWTVEDLTAALATLTPDAVMALKQASHAAAPELSAEHERETFLQSLPR